MSSKTTIVGVYTKLSGTFIVVSKATSSDGMPPKRSLTVLDVDLKVVETFDSDDQNQNKNDLTRFLKSKEREAQDAQQDEAERLLAETLGAGVVAEPGREEDMKKAEAERKAKEAKQKQAGTPA